MQDMRRPFAAHFALPLLGGLIAVGSIAFGSRFNRMDIGQLHGLTNDMVCVELRGRITATVMGDFVLTDETGSCAICGDENKGWRQGDEVTVLAYVRQRMPKPYTMSIYLERLFVRERGNRSHVPPPPTAISRLNPTEHDLQLVTIEGTVTDVHRDELDPGFVYAILESDSSVAVLTVHDRHADIDKLRTLVGKTIRATGIYRNHTAGYRRHISHLLYVDPETSIVPIDGRPNAHPRRTSFTGTVLAWVNDNVLYLRTEDDERLKIYLEHGTQHPQVGTRITASGFIRRNIFFTSLSSTRITLRSERPQPPEPPSRISPRQLLQDPDGKTKIQIPYEGRPIRFSGSVTDIVEPGTPNARITLNCDGIRAPVRVDALDPPPIGSEVEVSGICSITAESDGNPYGFVRLTGFTLLTRGQEDVVILKNPPWWTPAKMLAVIAALLLLVVAVLIWNKALRALAERRGRELMDEQLGHVAADLKVNERTRLAVELHDALSQNLTGVSLQLDAVKRFADEDRGKMTRHLDMAMRTLKSCRDELRNCLWDLRNRALEERDMNEAIRRTASPFVGDAALLIRFNVPRDQISDNTAHALMRIIRELATNAVRHGGAKTIRIAGTLENGRLLFSVNDNGSGFDPQHHPGVDGGHFGLDGIRERISRFDGTLEIESAAGKGATIRISMTA